MEKRRITMRDGRYLICNTCADETAIALHAEEKRAASRTSVSQRLCGAARKDTRID